MTTKSKGEQTAATEAGNSFSLISNEKLLQLYATMLKCRIVEERVRVLFKQSNFGGNCDAAVGREASAVGVAVDLLPEDAVGPSHRDILVNFIAGAPLETIFRHLFARAASPDKGRSAPAHRSDAPPNAMAPPSTIAAQLHIATGAALANKMRKNGKIAVAFSGDGPASMGLWREALNLAGAQNLPIVFVCQNSLSAASVSLQQQAEVEDMALKAQACGLPGIAVDGNDVVAVYRVASEAIAHARRGNGPTLIECKTCRLPGRSEIDPGNCRPADELEQGEANDPILNMEKYLAGKGLYREELKAETAAEFARELDAAIETAERSPSTGEVEALDHPDSFSIRERVLHPRIWTPEF
jgi:TPP-dependent pyruvate/acetoin dehydrogenase alpha subunit